VHTVSRQLLVSPGFNSRVYLMIYVRINSVNGLRLFSRSVWWCLCIQWSLVAVKVTGH